MVLTVDVADLVGELDALLSRPLHEQVVSLAQIGRRCLERSVAPGLRSQVIEGLVAIVDSGTGTPQERLDVGEVLGLLGDPRLRSPSDPDYWIVVQTEDGPLRLGRFPVTNAEFKRFVDEGGYSRRELWSDAAWDWLQGCDEPWPVRSRADDAKPFVVANQPVVGVTWYEAEAFARAHGARLPRFDERLRAVRGEEKRPYPWGSPFGEGNANTQEEVLRRPCAVGLYVRDRTPEGVFDLAGNVGEWALDGAGDQFWYAPGAWDQPSMAAWAKARELAEPDSRWAGVGFRLARD